MIFLYTGSSELVNRTETSKLKDAPRALPARQSGERLFGVHELRVQWPAAGVHELTVFMSSELIDRLPDAHEL